MLKEQRIVVTLWLVLPVWVSEMSLKWMHLEEMWKLVTVLEMLVKLQMLLKLVWMPTDLYSLTELLHKCLPLRSLI